MAAKLLAIVGETASGKTALAIELAQKFDGEIICADSRTVYKGLDISTAKPSQGEQTTVKHHMLDVVKPNQSFSVADFQKQANRVIHEIQSKGKLPILVGGTGLYIDAVLYGYEFSSKDSPRNENNPRHLADDVPAKKSRLRPNTLILGLRLDRDKLNKRIENRAEHMIACGLLDEIKAITQTYSWDLEALQTPAFKAFRPYLQEEISLAEAKACMVSLDKQLAKRQRTWFKRNPDIHWLNNSEQAFELTRNLLNKKQ